MKKAFLLTTCIALSVTSWAQSAAGLQAGVTSCGVGGAFVTSVRRTGFTGQLWGEWRATEMVGVKAAVGYVQRGGALGGIYLEPDFLTLHLMPRVHVAVLDSRVQLLGGLGVYRNIATLRGKPDLVKSRDFGVDAEIGFEWEYFALLIRTELSLIDVTELSKDQYWVSYGLSAQVPIYRGKSGRKGR